MQIVELSVGEKVEDLLSPTEKSNDISNTKGWEARGRKIENKAEVYFAEILSLANNFSLNICWQSMKKWRTIRT